MTKRVLSLLMTLILALSAFPALAESPDSSAAEIASALENDIIPHELIGEDLTRGLTHAELSALAVRLFEAFWQTQEIPVETPYAAVEGHPLQGEIEKAYGLGFLLDMNGAYYPDYLATRQWTAQVLCRVLKSWMYDDWTLAQDSGYFLSYSMSFRFADDRDIDGETVDSVYFLSSNDLMPGMNGELFCPQDVVSRAAAIIAANRIYMKYRNVAVEAEQPGSATPEQTVAAPAQEDIYALMGKQISGYFKRYGLVKADGSLWTWGEKYLGNGEQGRSDTPVHIMDDVSAVYMGGDASLALKTDGTLWAWGSNYGRTVGNGQDGGEQLTPVMILDHVVTASMGNYTAAAVTEDGGLYIWGYNSDGNLGVNIPAFGGPKQYLTPTRIMEGVKDVSCNNANYGAFTMVLKQDGTLWTFGSDQFGQLGDGRTDLGNQFWKWPDGGNFGRAPYEYEPRQIMDHVVSIYAGDRMGTAIRDDGTLWTWGWNKDGRLGNGGAHNTNATDNDHVPCQTYPLPVADNVAAVRQGYGHHTAILKRDGTVWMCGRGYGDTPAMINIGNVVALATGEFENYALKADGTLWKWNAGYADPVQVTDISR